MKVEGVKLPMKSNVRNFDLIAKLQLLFEYALFCYLRIGVAMRDGFNATYILNQIHTCAAVPLLAVPVVHVSLL